ncbi:YaaC family protein [Burkholderia vietnamiensis]|uniref:YaaC family protein n=1 Tax=Burkholderia vietnamiensis TaxID=60552 RepID=UPI0009C06721|nr:YaaC family protein [Burkholderia vietnamiensis]
MIITSVNLIKARDITQYCWSRLAQFQNIQLTSNLICDLHGIQNTDRSSRSNAKNQAEQIKYCLAQAQEYFNAATSVSLATKPVLLYYCTMSMALSEILLKQSGDSRLSKLREEHNCHGLQLGVRATPKPEDSLEDSSSSLIAKPQRDISGALKGTFEVWRRSAREHPVAGKHTTFFSSGANQQGYGVILGANDVPPPELPRSGVSLFDCMRELPYMTSLIKTFGINPNLVRASISNSRTEIYGQETIELIIHPAHRDTIDKFGNLVELDPEAINAMTFKELPSGYIVTYQPTGQIHMTFPSSTSINQDDFYFSCSGLNLGEFGFLYCALHICGNFARYYPDIWLKHIEKSSPLSMAIDELCSHALERLPLLVLSEMLRSYQLVHE